MKKEKNFFEIFQFFQKDSNSSSSSGLLKEVFIINLKPHFDNNELSYKSFSLSLSFF